MELTDFWDVVNGLRRQRRPRHRLQPDQDQAGHQADQHQLGRAHHQVELPGLPALPVGRHRDGGRRRSDAAVADRGGEGRDPERPQGGDREARRGREEGPGRSARSALCRPRRSPGTQARSAPRGCRWRLWDADQGPRLVDRRGSPATSATGRSGCGRWRSTTIGSAARAAPASATAWPARSAARSPIATSAAGSRSRSRATAT